MCQGFIAGHFVGGAVTAAFGYRTLAVGVLLLGIGWVAPAMAWEKLAARETQGGTRP
jgi:hypothetical protein